MYKLIIARVPYSVLSCVYRQQEVEPHDDGAPVGRVQVTLAEDDVKPAETNGQVRDGDVPGGCRGPFCAVSGQRENLLSAGCLVGEGRSQRCRDSMHVDIQRLRGGPCRVSVLGCVLVSKVVRFAPFAVLWTLDCVPSETRHGISECLWLSSLEETQPEQFTV